MGERGLQGRWRWGWPVMLLGLAAAVPLLVWLGWSAISGSSDGTDVGGPVDPSAPGYQAYVDPTPTLLLIHGDGDGLEGVTLLALTDPGVEGAVLFLAPETSTPAGPLSVRWDQAGSSGVADGVAELLGVRAGELQVADDGGWAALVSAVAPISFDNPDVLVSATGEARFESGALALAAADVGPYLGWRNPGESPVAALFRHELFWGVWLEKAALSASPDVFPGEDDRGVGRFGRALAKGRVRLEALPVIVDAGGAVVLDAAAVGEMVNEVIPFPNSASGGNSARVRLLNGTGDPALIPNAARSLSRAGAQITIIGNASEFGWETTKIAYHHVGFASYAEGYRDALGAGSVVAEEQPASSIDITVTFGADFAPVPGGGG
ncbi:LytR C-terminal domain-containing protein [Candidatus Poriferisocius sp.]|uniref:LytR C-terminal domain-containing protein n=1 Tax=Candidatus Poriferisocius sp. TaxID=3101276 RepID=UPI003B02AFDC